MCHFTIVQLTTVSAGLSVPLKRDSPYGYTMDAEGVGLSRMRFLPEQCWFFSLSCPFAVSGGTQRDTLYLKRPSLGMRGRTHRRGEAGERDDTGVDEKEPTRMRRWWPASVRASPPPRRGTCGGPAPLAAPGPVEGRPRQPPGVYTDRSWRIRPQLHCSRQENGAAALLKPGE